MDEQCDCQKGTVKESAKKLMAERSGIDVQENLTIFNYSTSSIELRLSPKGDTEIQVKVYDVSPDKAYAKAKELFLQAKKDLI